jgi:hypothetical protein
MRGRNALLEVKTVFKPSKHPIIEARLKDGGESRESGDKPRAWFSIRDLKPSRRFKS